LIDALARLWRELRGEPAPARPSKHTAIVPATDAAELLTDAKPEIPQWQAQDISGTQVVISYIDSKRQASERQIICRSLESRAGLIYLTAFCLERKAVRSFRGDRIASVIDPDTGEVHTPGERWLARFSNDSATTAPLRYGLPPRQYADFNAALNVLAFIARCDGEWHELEQAAIIRFARNYWDAAAISTPFDPAEIARHAARLGPDPETFFVSLDHCLRQTSHRAGIGGAIVTHLADVIKADGEQHPKELYWAEQVLEVMEQILPSG
jgi:uncharacterized tellurite resistance protein B-like protein